MKWICDRWKLQICRSGLEVEISVSLVNVVVEIIAIGRWVCLESIYRVREAKMRSWEMLNLRGWWNKRSLQKSASENKVWEVGGKPENNEMPH